MGTRARLIVVASVEAATALREVVKPACDVKPVGAPLHDVYERVTVVGLQRHRLTAAEKRFVAKASAVNAVVEWF